MSDRLPDWEERLNALLADSFSRRYEPAQHDCMIFACRAIEAVTGVDHYSQHLGAYASDKAGYLYLAKKLGHRTLASFFAERFDPRPVGHAMRGDIVLTSQGMPGVVTGGEALITATDGVRDGLFPVPRAEWVEAWAV